MPLFSKNLLCNKHAYHTDSPIFNTVVLIALQHLFCNLHIMDIKQKIFQYSDRHAQAKPILIHTINTVRHCQSFKQSNVFHALCPAPTMASLREAASYVRMSCRLVWVTPSFIPHWAPRVRAFNSAMLQLWWNIISNLMLAFWFYCLVSILDVFATDF